MELLNQIFCVRKARNVLFTDTTILNATIDEIIELWKDHVEEPSVWHVLVEKNNKLHHHHNNSNISNRYGDTDGGDDDGDDDESKAKIGWGCKLCQKLTISIGLLCADSIPAQTRAGDRSLVTLLLEFIKKRKPTTHSLTTTTATTARAAPSPASASSATSSNDAIKWALWTIFVSEILY